MSTDDVLTRVATDLVRLDENGVAAAKITAILGLPDDEIALIRETQEYGAAQARYVSQRALQQVASAEQSQNIVHHALKNVATALAENGDGDFALRALSVMTRMAKDKHTLAQEQQMRDIAVPGGVVVLAIPPHLLPGLQDVTPERIQAQQLEARDSSKQVGMIGSEILKQYMGMGDEGKVIDSSAVISVEDFQGLL